MATARKRGDSWRCLAYIGTVDGKRRYKSFTAKTKKAAERLAAAYEGKPTKAKTIGDAVSQYIDMKEAVLSPSTIRSYRAYLQNALEPISGSKLDSFSSADAQKWIKQMVANGKSPKYIRNAYGLLTSSIRLMRPQEPISATLPTKEGKYSYVPTNDEIRQIMPLFDEEMQIAIELAAYCSLRCGEICALTDKDLTGNLLRINKAIVRTPSGEYVSKMPKTARSVRTVTVPSFLLVKLQKRKGKYVKRTPLALSLCFSKTAKDNGIPFHFHDLRHFFASELAKTMPLAVIERMGGWSPGSPVLRQIYIGAQEAEMQKNMAAATAIFEKMQPSMQP